MEFAAFAEYAAAIEAEPADLAIRDLVTDLLRDVAADRDPVDSAADPAVDDDLAVVARFVQGRVFPAHDETKLDVGPRYCYEAIARAAGPNVTRDDVEARLADVGDVGEVAASYDFGSQQGLAAFGAGGTDPLTVGGVYDELAALAAREGEGSHDAKIDALFGLFNRCSPDEARYLARLVLSEMRIGVGEGTVRDAIADAFDAPVARVERALQVSNDYGLVACVACDRGVEGVDDIHLEVGRPVQAMLAQAGTVTDALEDWGEAAVEWKFDGARVQLHYDGEDVRVFSRNMEDVTDPLPEVVDFAEQWLDRPVILDGEAIAIDDDGRPLPFQEILRRFRRKHDVEQAREEVGVEVRFFDCLHADGEDLLDAPLTERHDRLDSLLDAGVSDLVATDDPEEIASVEAAALDAGHEGIMLKNPESTYSPGKRGKNWLKRKPDVETLDLVVTGAEWGEGRRASLLGTFLLSARDGDVSGQSPEARETESRGGFETIGKVATGVTDEELEELTELLEPHVRSQDGQEVDLEPAVVFEVGYEEIQRSPTYSSGYALRFPRFVSVREDLDPDDADSLERVERLVEG
jgi:DNA ligase-1